MHFRSLKILLIFVGIHMQLHFLPVNTSGVVTIRLVQFVNPSLSTAANKCCETGFLWQCRTQACDPAFSICVSNDTSGICTVGRVNTDTTPDTDSITFGSTIQNTTNPISFRFKNWFNSVGLSIKVCNNRCTDGPNIQVIDEYNYSLTPDPEPNGQHNHKHTMLKIGQRSKLEAEIHVHCDPDYYGDCTRFCKPHPYRYQCDCTGHKICRSGWTGENCEINIDECLTNKCMNNASCRDGINGYYCLCHRGFTGRYCENIVTKSQSTTTGHKATTENIFASTSQTETKSVSSMDNTTNTNRKETSEAFNTTNRSQNFVSKSKTVRHTEQTTINQEMTVSSKTSQKLHLQSLRRSGNLQSEDNNMILPPGGVVGISVSIVGLVLLSVIAVKLYRWCRMKDGFNVNDGSSTSSGSEDIASFDNQALQSEWMYYRT